MHGFKFIGSMILVGISTSLLTGIFCVVILTTSLKDPERLLTDFYTMETMAYASPHEVREALDVGATHFTLVDLRSPQEYEEEHIIGAINIPAFTDLTTPALTETDRIIGQFKTLALAHPDKDIIVYCHSTSCMTSRTIGRMLAKEKIFVKQLSIGWNDWRYFWTLWNHKHEWGKTYSEDYVARGTEPGILKKKETPSPCGEGKLEC